MEFARVRQLRQRRSLILASTLAEELNHREPGIRQVQAGIAAYIRWINAGSPSHCPVAARPLFARPVRAKLRALKVSSNRPLDLAGFRNRDILILRLAEVSRAGDLNRVRECLRCRRWFAAADLKRKFCSDTCRSVWFSAHAGRARAALNNRRWRIRNVHLPAVETRIHRLKSLRRPLTKAEAARLERAETRRQGLEAELRELNDKLREKRHAQAT